ncbi:MAG: hypothetical protein EA376_09045 [Phycisphaeraceae bacterium]|nr:MAG: hypothetical protein EA376_09045 [Phycisphaeraceae bacterium]
MRQKNATGAGSNAYRNGALTAIAVLLATLLAQSTVGLPGVSQADAQSRSATRQTGGIINPADQRQAMIAELKRLNDKIDTLSDRLGRPPFDVNVMRMPRPQSDGD